MGPPWTRAKRGATMEAWRRHRGRYRWRDLLFGGLNDAMFGVVSHLLRRPFAFWRFVQIVAPGLTANGGALCHFSGSPEGEYLSRYEVYRTAVRKPVQFVTNPPRRHLLSAAILCVYQVTGRWRFRC